MATSAEHAAQAEQLLTDARESRAKRRSIEESDALRAEAAVHSRLSIAAALRELAAKASPAAPATSRTA